MAPTEVDSRGGGADVRVRGRTIACTQLLDRLGLDALVATSPASVFYLSGFLRNSYPPMDNVRPVAALLIRGETTHLVLPAVERSIAERTGSEVTVHGYALDATDATAVIADELRRVSARSIGVEKSSLPWALASSLRSRILELDFQDVTDALELTWTVKSEAEIFYIGRAADLCVAAFHAAATAINSKAPELVVQGCGDAAIFDTAAREFPNLRVQVASGVVTGDRTSAAGAHEISTGRTPQIGEPIFMWWGAACEGYWAMMSRSIIWRPSDTLRRLHDRLHAAKRAALREVRPGARGSAVYQAAVETLARIDAPNISAVHVGRGIGAKMGESPSLDASCNVELVPGMTLRIGPEVYGPWGGLGLIDTLVVTSDGHRTLTEFPETELSGRPR